MATQTRSIPFGRPMIGDEERRAVADVLSGPILTHGPRGKQFEDAFADFTGAPHALVVTSCAAALHLSYLALGLEPGDEVIVPAQTHVATAHAVEICGARPVFVDSDPATGNIDVEQAASLVSDRTRAFSLVHYLGRPVDMTAVLEVARKHDLFVVEDAALAVGGRIAGTHVGLLGDVGCFSFYPVKHLTTGEGGMVITTREDVAERISKQRAFGIDKTVVAERRHSGAYDVELLGVNYRMSEIGAALGIEQMKRVPGFLDQRRENYRALAAALADVPGLRVLDTGDGEGVESGHYCLVAILPQAAAARRDEVIELLKARGVGASIYYPRPVPLTTYYRNRYAYREGQFPVAEQISFESLALPVGPHLEVGDAEAVAGAVRSVLAEVASG
jgi:dTDP-4-amino-4,6-dideoxygalactose transaminase